MWDKIKSFLFKNKTDKQTVAKNTVWLTISNFGGRMIKAIIVIYAARVLGTAGYGVFSYAITLAGFLALFTDPGINSVLMRDGAKASDEERTVIFSGTILIKIIAIIASTILIIFLGPYFTTLPGAKILLPVTALILTFDSLREFFTSLLRSKERMQWDAGIYITTNVAIVIFGFILMYRNPTALSLGWGYALGTILGGLFAMVVVWDDIRKAFRNFSTRLVGSIIQSAWPFAAISGLSLLFTNTDILIISWMKTASDVGIYSAAIRVIQVLYLVPYIIQTGTLPLFSRLAQKDHAKFKTVLERTLSVVFLASLPVAIGGLVLSTQIMTLIFGSAFASGSPAFRILLVTLIFDYPASVIANALFAYAHQKSLVVSSALGGATNVILDLLLIPRFGMTGSAVATLIAQAVTNWYLWHMMKKVNYFEVLPTLKKMFAASIIMGITTTLLFFAGANVIVNVIISGAVYLLFLKIFREPALKEMVNIVRPTQAPRTQAP
jgi:O-antigen/teichoic acid export membrane protein